MKPEIFAVIWFDFIPLSLRYASEGEAISAAKAMDAKSRLNGIALGDLRAVRLNGADKLENLWKPEN